MRSDMSTKTWNAFRIS